MNSTKPRYSQRYRAYVLLILTGVYTFNFIDRQILVIIQESIKKELLLSDAQLGMLTGLAFAIFYVTLGIPIARYADKNNRRDVVSLSLAVWSAMTALSGLVTNYVQLLLARIGVGVGEAGSAGPTHSMISDYFLPQHRATALAIYSTGVYIGILAGYSIGGWIDATYGWRIAFFALGIPGILYAIFVRVLVKEPPKGNTDQPITTASGQEVSFKDAVKILFSKKTFIFVGLATGFHTFGSYGVGNFFAPFLARVHAMPVGEIGTWLGICAGFGGVIGTFAGGYLSDILGKKDLRWYLWLPLAAGIINYLPSYFAFFLDNTQWVLFCLFCTSLLTGIFLGPCLAVAHNLVGAKMRALSSAILFLLLNFIGLGLGPLCIGFLSDYLMPTYGKESLRYAFLFTFITSAFSILLFYVASKTYPQEALMGHVSDKNSPIEKNTRPSKAHTGMGAVLNIVVGAFLLFLVGLFFLQMGIAGKVIMAQSPVVLGVIALLFLGGVALVAKGVIQGK